MRTSKFHFSYLSKGQKRQTHCWRNQQGKMQVNMLQKVVTTAQRENIRKSLPVMTEIAKLTLSPKKHRALELLSLICWRDAWAQSKGSIFLLSQAIQKMAKKRLYQPIVGLSAEEALWNQMIVAVGERFCNSWWMPNELKWQLLKSSS